MLNFISWKKKHQCVTSLIFIELEVQLNKIYRYCINIGRIYVYWIVLKFSFQYTCSFRCTSKCYHIKKQADTLPPTPTPTPNLVPTPEGSSSTWVTINIYKSKSEKCISTPLSLIIRSKVYGKKNNKADLWMVEANKIHQNQLLFVKSALIWCKYNDRA